MKRFLRINSNDNVAVNVDSSISIPPGHKVALKEIRKGEPVIKYGQVIGIATIDIKEGEWVHSHNMKTALAEERSYSYHPSYSKMPKKEGVFFGYPRNGRRAGIRNEIYIIPSVGCVNGIASEIVEKAKQLDLGSIDGIYVLSHPFGCSQLGQDQENLKDLLISLALNPNATFVLFLGLGCENNQIKGIQEALEDLPHDHIRYLVAQKVDDEVSSGVEILKEFINQAKDLKRVEVPLSELCIGLKCGGSDGFSGITANPTVGKVADEIVSYGGSAILTETPEMFGAEQLLMNRCLNEDVYTRYKKMIEDFRHYYEDQGFPVYENPSPGNKEGGITTLEEKSLGCITKGGSSPIVDVLPYGGRVVKPGLNVLDGPGNDLIASTSLAAAGAQLILFTTGRGTPFSPAVPTLKIASNAALASHKKDWIDFDASTLSDAKLWELVIATASGEYHTKKEGHREIAFFKKGVTL